MFPGFSEVASARYNVGLAQVFGEVGYGVALGNIAAEPFAGLAYVRLHSGSFAESGGLAALNGANGDQDIGYSMLGARFATSWVLPSGPAVTPRISAAWQHAFGNVTPAAALTFQTLGTSFNVAGVPLGRDAAVVDAGFDVHVAPQATLGLSYFGKIAEHAQDHSVKGTFAYRFSCSVPEFADKVAQVSGERVCSGSPPHLDLDRARPHSVLISPGQLILTSPWRGEVASKASGRG